MASPIDINRTPRIVLDPNSQQPNSSTVGDNVKTEEEKKQDAKIAALFDGLGKKKVNDEIKVSAAISIQEMMKKAFVKKA